MSRKIGENVQADALVRRKIKHSERADVGVRLNFNKL